MSLLFNDLNTVLKLMWSLFHSCLFQLFADNFFYANECFSGTVSIMEYELLTEVIFSLCVISASVLIFSLSAIKVGSRVEIIIED